jgi:hypothetical protein
MTEKRLRTEAQKLANHIQSLGNDFAILTAKPENHIGAIIADAVLQVGHRWKTHVEKRVKRIKTAYPGAATLSGLSRLLATIGEKKLLDWEGRDEQKRFRQTIQFFSKEQVNGKKINTVSDLARWLNSDANRDRLLTRSQRKDRAGIPRVGDKTADYYRVMVGLPDAVAIDSLITKFLRDAGVKGRSQYNKARAIVQRAASILSEARNEQIRPIDLDRSIWTFQSKHRRLKDQQNKHSRAQGELERISSTNENQFRRRVAMTQMSSYSRLPAEGRAMVEAKNNDSWRNAGREIVIAKKWTACLVCWGGPLDQSTVEDKHNASLSHKEGKKPYLWIPVKLWIGGTRYDGTLRYALNGQGACITNPLTGGIKLGHVMTAAGFVAGERICLKFIGNEAWVLKSP